MPQKEPEWLDKARKTFRFHRTKLIENPKWTIAASAKALKRSIGSISEDLMIVRWSRTHEDKLLKLHTQCEALEFIRTKKKTMEMEIR